MEKPTASTNPTRALGRALIVYAGVGWAFLEATDLLSERLDLPDWTFTTVALALVLGLPVVLATAWFTAVGARRRREDTAEALPLHIRLFTWRNAVLGGLGAFALIGLAQTLSWVTGAALGQSETDWARTEGLALLADHLDARDLTAAHPVALRLLAALPEDTAVLRMAAEAAPEDSIDSEPAGATVYRRQWGSTDEGAWQLLGTTPLVVRSPPEHMQYRFELEGHRTQYVGGRGDRRVELTELEAPFAEMVRVPGNPRYLFIPGFDHLRPPEDMPDFWIDRHEVTNAEYRAFVDAGGYESAEFWQEPFLDRGMDLSWDEAMARFVDRSGRPGPATWTAGDFADGTEDHPVAGVSWFEAEAYARFRNKSLPTLWHWNRASTPPRSNLIVESANIGDGTGTWPVGSSGSMSGFGAFDMAGNVREWAWNLNPVEGERFLLGGGWDDPDWAFNDAQSHSPWDRQETNGIRLAVYDDPAHPSVAQALEPVPGVTRDFYAETPVSDEVFEAYRGMYVYDPMPLNAVVEQTDTTSNYIGERVTVDAAYDGDRLIAYVYRPIDGVEPFQTVIYFPGSNVIYQRQSQMGFGYSSIPFVLKSGRAVVAPVYKGTFERGGELSSDYPDETASFRRYVIQWVQDFNRAIDYVEERPDLDHEKIAYYGSSWGGYLGAIIPTVSPRVDAVVLRVAGLTFQRALPEVEAINYLPRLTIPVIMINGEHDFFFPVETSQKPMFDLLGSPPELKRHVVYPGSHSVPLDMLTKESLDWLDAHLGPVER